MGKKDSVRLTNAERESLREVIKKRRGSAEKVRRAQSLLKAAAAGSMWTEARIAEAVAWRTKTVENMRQRLVTEGFAGTLEGKRRQTPPRPRRLDGAQAAKGSALRLGKPPRGFATWSLRLLAEKGVARGIVEAVSHDTVRQPLKKTACRSARFATGGFLRKPVARLSPVWKQCGRRRLSPTLRGFQWEGGLSKRSSYSRRPACPLRLPRGIRAESILNTHERERQASSCFATR
jgi:homeodomain-containing protein